MMKAYKGFKQDMTCRGFQYEEGKTYETDSAELCKCGFHACEMPLDVFGYYPPATSEYHEVEVDELAKAEKQDDSKIAGKRIKIGAKLSIRNLVEAQIEYVKERTHLEGEQATGYQGAASATGDQGAASATGNLGAASATGYQGAASATGCQGAASATGDQGAASATGYKGAASATGYKGAASATGCQGAASATGYKGAASATGNLGAASATGYQGAASATGKASVAMACGKNGHVKGALGCVLFLVERGEWDGETFPILSCGSAIVDGTLIKADTWYTLKDGKFIEIEYNPHRRCWGQRLEEGKKWRE